MKSTLFRILTILFILILVLFLASAAYARLGGGESYSSGSGSGSSGYHGSGHGDGFPLYLLLRLVIALFRFNPLLGIVFVIFIIYVIYKMGTSREIFTGNTSTFSPQVFSSDYKAKDVHEKIDIIKQKDPGFNEISLLKKLNDGFVKMQAAWSMQNIESIRPFVSGSVFTRFATQIADQKKSGLRNNVENIKIRSSEIVAAASDKWFDTIHIRFVVELVDYMTDLKTGKIVKGSKVPGVFTEFWSFLRRPGIKTKQEGGLWEGNCPSCGAILKISENSQCEFCKAIVNSGDYDWVLSEITQESVWAAASTSSIKGVEVASQMDSFFSPQLVEDVASTIFWKDLAARKQNSSAPLKRYVNESYIENMMASWQAPGGGITYYDSAAVGAVNLESVELKNEWMICYVRIMFSGARITLFPYGNKQNYQSNIILPESKIYELKKKISTKPNYANGLASLNCPNCGAPESSSDKDTCDFCGTPLASGEYRWVLSDIITPQDYMQKTTCISMSGSKAVDLMNTMKLTDEIMRVEGPKSIVAGLVFVAAADGVIDSDEKEFLYLWGDKVSIPRETIDTWIEAAPGMSEAPRVQVPRNEAEAAAWAHALIKIAAADGVISNKERYSLRQFCGRFGIQILDLDALIENEMKSRK